jgi:hypothetical protein
MIHECQLLFLEKLQRGTLVKQLAIGQEKRLNIIREDATVESVDSSSGTQIFCC